MKQTKTGTKTLCVTVPPEIAEHISKEARDNLSSSAQVARKYLYEHITECRRE